MTDQGVRSVAVLRYLEHNMVFKKYVTYIVVLIAIVFSSCKEEVVEQLDQKQKVSIDPTYRPLFHHFSSTDCGPCGRLGVPTLRQIAADMGDSVLTLITHFKYRDPFITASSQAIEQAFLLEWYSPQLWVNNDNISNPAIYNGLENAVIYSKSKLREAMNEKPRVYVGMQYVENELGRYDADLVVQNVSGDSATYFVEIYTMEDSLVAAQAGNDPYVATHYGVNRGGFFGQMGKEVNLGANEEYRESLEIVPCYGCKVRNLYFYMIVWEHLGNGKYGYVNGKQIRNE